MNASERMRPVALGGVEGPLDVADVTAERLLAEDVLAGLERLDRPLAVHRVRQRDVDRLDLRVGEQLLVRAVGPRDLPLLRELLGPREVAAADRDDVDVVRLVRARRASFLLMSAVERIPHFTAIVYPQLVSVMGLNATSRMRWLRGRVSTKSTVSATSSADIIPASSGMSGVRP